MNLPGPISADQTSTGADEALGVASWTKTFVRSDHTIRQVLETIDAAEMQIALVVDEGARLLGVISDGDVRRALLRGHGLDALASEIMTKRPVTATPDMKLAAIERLMHARQVHQVPVIDGCGVIVGLALYGKLLPRRQLVHDAILMVGGFGRRLGALTAHVPKPLLRLGEKPILELILESLLMQGFHRFHLAVHYRAEMIERHFGNGRRWGAEISYLREQEPLGTCGALSLLETVPACPFLVMNGDILSRLDFADLFAYHRSHGGSATMVVRGYDVQIPFGVAHTDGRKVRSLAEKPTERYAVNAGVYVLEPSTLALIPKGGHFDMTTLLQLLIDRDLGVFSYPVSGPWIDVGGAADLQRIHADFDEFWRDDEAAP